MPIARACVVARLVLRRAVCSPSASLSPRVGHHRQRSAIALEQLNSTAIGFAPEFDRSRGLSVESALIARPSSDGGPPRVARCRQVAGKQTATAAVLRDLL